MNIPQHILEATRRRYAERNPLRAANIQHVKTGDIRSANDERQFELRRERLAAAGGMIPVMTSSDMGGAAAIIASTAAQPTFDLAVERVIGRSDFVGVAYLEQGLRASATVGRIQVGARNGGIHAFGTGFLVAPRLLLTNNHVLAGRGQAMTSNVEFNYQYGIDGRLELPVTFELDPGTFFITDTDLDYSLVAVRERSIDGTIALSDYGWNPLIEQTGKVVIGEAVNIIQHPEAQPKKVALRENQIVDILDNFLHYRTDTSPGSSGAPVFNDQWELIGLHHSGVPDMTGDGRIRARNGGPWTSDMGEDQINWIANEGVRISRIIGHVRDQRLGEGVMELFAQGLEAPPIDPRSAVRHTAPPASRGRNEADTIAQPAIASITIDTEGGTTWTIPLQIAVHVGKPLPTATADGTGTTISSAADTETEAPAASDFDPAPEYADRLGYIRNFLGGGALHVPLPALGPAIAGDAVPLIGRPTQNELKYINYSVVMNRKRRMAFFTAVNIDGNALVKLTRGDDKWKFDPRIPEEFQIGEDAYSRNDLDRGHLVRRLDPVWGTEEMAVRADADTFHFTNCTPQHKDFNQRTWLSLEDYILRNADTSDMKVSVFTGPVFRDDDRTYRSIRLPQQFWKLAVMVHDGRLSATAYMLSQSELLNRLEAAFVYGPFKTYQVPIRLVEELTGLDFGTLRDNDPLGTQVAPHESLLESDVIRGVAIEITDEGDLRF